MRALLVILAALTTISCTTPVTPRLHEPDKPDYPHFTKQEIIILESCMQDDKPICEVPDEILIKMRDKDIMCRGYVAEAITVIRTNNARTK